MSVTSVIFMRNYCFGINLTFTSVIISAGMFNVVRGEIDEKTADIQARSFMARILEDNGKECQAEGEAKVVT